VVSRKSSFKTFQPFNRRAPFKSFKAAFTLFRSPVCDGGSRGDEAGFQPFRKEPVRVAASFSNEELGEVLLQTLSHCE
jgi:hypothetical protein